jgi:hypothetical protein
MSMLEGPQELHDARKVDIHCLITKRMEDELYLKLIGLEKSVFT